MGRIRHVLRHRAVPLSLVEDDSDPDEWPEGEPGEGPEPTEGTEFRCILFLPTGTEDDNPFRPRNITRPTLLYEPVDELGADLPLEAAHELRVTADREPPPARALIEGRWQVDGDPQAFGPPGRTIGMLANLSRVGD